MPIERLVGIELAAVLDAEAQVILRGGTGCRRGAVGGVSQARRGDGGGVQTPVGPRKRIKSIVVSLDAIVADDSGAGQSEVVIVGVIETRIPAVSVVQGDAVADDEHIGASGARGIDPEIS